MSKHRNRLMFEKSPYLLQHAHNPVDWYPWGEEAFQKAHREDKPIFLSIGYSTCHWCHIMAHESFEDEEVARLMNDAFVCIKVDREERPDLDQIYMSVAQAVTGRGGWPLNVILTPDKKPFFASTYIPKENRHGNVGMLELVPRIKVLWKTQRDEILQSADQITSALQESAASASASYPVGELDQSTLDLAYRQLVARFDSVHGGFGGAPKFPSPHNLLFLLRYWRRTGDAGGLQIVEVTLKTMRRGGIFDHVGFGFHRYSTDGEWLLPHFEKMLYDQAMISLAYLEAYQATGKEEYAGTAEQIFAYLLRDMISEEGGFFSAEDADSEGEEGKFYLWTEEQIREAFDQEEADMVVKLFGVEKEGNFVEEASGGRTGRNVLHLKKPVEEIASEMRLSSPELVSRLEEARQKLFWFREERVHPEKDDKILADWNGLMIAALSRGAQVLDRQEYEDAAEKAADFVLKEMRDKDGRLLHRYREGTAGVQANLDDYAFLIWGLIELYETNFKTRYLKAALELNQHLIEHFWDNDAGGFYFTPDDGEELIVRRKEANDSAIPSGNSVALLNLIRLARMTGETRWEEMASKTFRAFSAQAKGLPVAYMQLLMALDFALGPSSEVVIVGPSGTEQTEKMLRALRSKFLPNKVVLFVPTKEEKPEIIEIAPFTKEMEMVEGKATAYVCSGYVCQQPTTEAKEMLEKLG